MRTRHPDPGDGIGPPDQLVEVAPSQRGTVGAGEDESVGPRLDIPAQMTFQVGYDRRRESHGPDASARLRRTHRQAFPANLTVGTAHLHGAQLGVEVTPLYRAHLTERRLATS